MKTLWAALFGIDTAANSPSVPDVPSGIGALRYVSDTGTLQYWNGSAWVDVGANGGSVATGLTASTTQTRAGALQLTAAYNNVATVGTASDAVGLPDIKFIGQQVEVTNSAATNAMKVFPSSATNGGSTTIDGGSAGASVNISAAKSAQFTALSLTAWQSIGAAARAA